MSIIKKTKLSIIAPVDALLEATAKLLLVVPAKSPKPVLSNIRFSVRNGILELTGTNAMVGIHYTIPAASVKSEGEGLLNGIKFIELLKEFRGTETKIDFSDRGGCRFKAKGGKYKVIGDDIRDYPKTPRFETSKGLNILASDLVVMIKKTIFASAPEESRLSINGILMEVEDDHLRLIATDNKRMAINEYDIATNLDDFRVVVPSDFLRAILKVTSRDIADNIAVIGVSGKKVFYRLSGITVYSATIQGVFPPYGEVLNFKLKHHIDCSTKSLLHTLRRAMLINKDLIAFNFGQDILKLSAVSSLVGAGTTDMETNFTPPNGQEEIKIGFNPRYLRDALEVITTKRCRILFEGPKNAAILKELITNDDIDSVFDQFTYTVMPALLPRES
jgi:DNA polymerase III subunit beta